MSGPRSLPLVGAAVLGVCGCTAAELDAWIDWHRVDPAAAEQFADRPDIQAALAEPEPTVRTVWDALAWCESGGDWSYNGGSGYDGGLQFLPSVWRAYGGGEFADFAWQATRQEQIVVAERILADVGWQAWPTCSRRLGLR